MFAIVCVSENWGIGKDGDLLFHIKDDLRRFRELTLDKSVLMGRKTLESLPGGKPLPKRRNIVLTSRTEPIEGVELAANIDEVLSLVADDPADEVYVMGGGQVYAALLPHCEKVLLTKVYSTCEADTFFPDLDTDPAWKISHRSEILEEDGLKFQFIDYVRA